MLATLLTDCAYLPIDTNWPSNYKEQVFQDAGVKVRVYLKSGKDDFQLQPLNTHDVTVKTNLDLAYVIYTSGTTGKPKGVGVSGRNVLNLMSGLFKNIYDKYEPSTKIGLLSSFHFDASVQNIFACLMRGYELSILPEEIRADGKLILEFLRTHEIEICDATPSHIASMLGRVDKVPDDLTIKHLLIGGEVFTKSLALQLSKWFKKEVLFTNLYGPSECTVDASLYTFSSNAASLPSEVPIGKPINNSQILVLGEHQQMLPVGSVGELYIGGACIANGYINGSKSDDQKFCHLPIAKGRFYQTGDLGKWDEHGQLLFRGRKDSQIKIRGHRVELSEIELLLSLLKR